LTKRKKKEIPDLMSIQIDIQTDKQKDEIDKRKKDSHTNRQILTKRKKKGIPDLMSIQKDIQTDRK
jgi:hypothetical protein